MSVGGEVSDGVGGGGEGRVRVRGENALPGGEGGSVPRHDFGGGK